MPPSLRNTQTKYRKEIEQVKDTITSTEKYLISLQDVVKLRNGQFEAASDPALAAAIMQQMTLETQAVITTMEQLALYTQRLVQLEEILRRTEEEAEKRARGMLGLSIVSSLLSFVVLPRDATQAGLGEEGHSAYVIDIEKFQCMKKWLYQERVLLLQSPRGSGKTSFAVQFAKHLIDAGYSVKYLSAALGENQPNDETSMSDILEIAIGEPFSPFCRSRENPFHLIVDEAQIWYPKNAKKGRTELDNFWGEVKTLLKSGRDFSSYINERSGVASESAAASRSAVRVRLLCLAGCGVASLGPAATPLTFVNPWTL